MRTKCAQFPVFSLFLRRKRELFEAAAREQKGSAEAERGAWLGLFPRDRLDLSFFLPPKVSRIPQVPLPVSQHHHGPAPSHLRHYDTPGNPCYERSCNCYGRLQALEATRGAFMAVGLSPRVLIAPIRLS